MKSVCVFCGSRSGANEAYAEAARAVGTAMAAASRTLIYGGGHTGLMGAVADATLTAGGEVVGVIPRALAEREIAHLTLTRLETVTTMHERKSRMAELSDAFLVLPGGLGTMEELFEQWTWAQLGIHAKPLGLLNVDGFFDPLLAMVERFTRERFVSADQAALLHADDDAERLLDTLARSAARPVRPADNAWSVSP